MRRRKFIEKFPKRVAFGLALLPYPGPIASTQQSCVVHPMGRGVGLSANPSRQYEAKTGHARRPGTDSGSCPLFDKLLIFSLLYIEFRGR
jgi:hypothetical protein